MGIFGAIGYVFVNGGLLVQCMMILFFIILFKSIYNTISKRYVRKVVIKKIVDINILKVYYPFYCGIVDKQKLIKRIKNSSIPKKIANFLIKIISLTDTIYLDRIAPKTYYSKNNELYKSILNTEKELEGKEVLIEFSKKHTFKQAKPIVQTGKINDYVLKTLEYIEDNFVNKVAKDLYHVVLLGENKNTNMLLSDILITKLNAIDLNNPKQKTNNTDNKTNESNASDIKSDNIKVSEIRKNIKLDDLEVSS